LSSPLLAAAVVRGLRRQGVNTLRLGICPAPLLDFSVIHHGVIDGGIMITGAEAPADQNGFRLRLGRTLLHGDELPELRAFMERPASPRSAPSQVTDLDVFPLYRRYVYGKCLTVNPAISDKRRRIVIDLGNGTAATVFPRILHPHYYGIGLNFTMDGRFPNRHPAALTEKDLKGLSQAVRRESAEFGIALDADSNRMAVVDEKGRLFPEARLASFLSRSVTPKQRSYSRQGDAIFSALRFCETVSYLDGPISRF
jgi:phosphomannomutase